MRLTDGSRAARMTLWIDLTALTAFVIVGVASHGEAGMPAAYLRNAGPVLLAWLTVSMIAGTYRLPTIRTGLLTWIVAVPIGVVARSILLGRFGDRDQLVFTAVAMAFTLLFLSVGRVIAVVLTRRSAAP